MPQNWPEDPRARGRPKHQNSRSHNPRNRMEGSSGGGGGDQSGCFLTTMIAFLTLVGLVSGACVGLFSS